MSRLRLAEQNSRPIHLVLAALRKRKRDVSEVGAGQWKARCPAHADTQPSLSIGEADDGRVLLTCHSGCELDEIVKSLELDVSDLFPDESACPKPRPKATSSTARARVRTTRRPSKNGKAGVVEGKAAAPKGKGKKKDGKSKTAKLTTATKSQKNWAAMVRMYETALTSKQLSTLAKKLNLPPNALRLLHVGRRREKSGNSFCSFPEFDGHGRVTGISLRADDGSKKFVTGGKRGLYLPAAWEDRPGPIFIVEGATDTAALAAMGLAGIGRPSATGGVQFLVDLLAEVPEDREIIVLGEMDAKPDGKWPGKTGAEKVAKKLAQELGRTVKWALPPAGAKDVRAWLAIQEVNDAE